MPLPKHGRQRKVARKHMINLHNAEKDKRNFQDETENMSEQTRELLSPLLNLPDFVLWHMVNFNFFLFTYLPIYLFFLHLQ